MAYDPTDPNLKPRVAPMVPRGPLRPAFGPSGPGTDSQQFMSQLREDPANSANRVATSAGPHPQGPQVQAGPSSRPPQGPMNAANGPIGPVSEHNQFMSALREDPANSANRAATSVLPGKAKPLAPATQAPGVPAAASVPAAPLATGGEAAVPPVAATPTATPGMNRADAYQMKVQGNARSLMSNPPPTGVAPIGRTPAPTVPRPGSASVERTMGTLGGQYRQNGPGIGPNKTPEALPAMRGAPRMNQPLGLGPNGAGQVPPGQPQLPAPAGLAEPVNPLRVRGGNPAGPGEAAPAARAAQSPPPVSARHAVESVAPGGELAVPRPQPGTAISPVAKPYTNIRQLGPNQPPSVSAANTREAVGPTPERGPRYPTFAEKGTAGPGSAHGPSSPFWEPQPPQAPSYDFFSPYTPPPGAAQLGKATAEYAGTYRAPVTPAPKGFTPGAPGPDFYTPYDPKAAGKAAADYAYGPKAHTGSFDGVTSGPGPQASPAGSYDDFTKSVFDPKAGSFADYHKAPFDPNVGRQARTNRMLDRTLGLTDEAAEASMAGMGRNVVGAAGGVAKGLGIMDVTNEMGNQVADLVHPVGGGKGILDFLPGSMSQVFNPNANDREYAAEVRNQAGENRTRIPTVMGLATGEERGGAVHDPNYKTPDHPIYFPEGQNPIDFTGLAGKVATGAGLSKPGESLQDTRARLESIAPTDRSTLQNFLTSNRGTMADQMGLGDVNRYFGGSDYAHPAPAPAQRGTMANLFSGNAGTALDQVGLGGINRFFGGSDAAHPPTPSVPPPAETPAVPARPGGAVAGTQDALPADVNGETRSNSPADVAEMTKMLQAMPDKSGPLPPSGQSPVEDFAPPTTVPAARPITAPAGRTRAPVSEAGASGFPTQPAPPTIIPGSQSVQNDPLDGYRMGLIDQINDLGSAPFQRQAALSALHAIGGGKGNSAERGQAGYHADSHFDPLAADKSGLLASQALAARSEANKNYAHAAQYSGASGIVDRQAVLNDEHDLYLHILGQGNSPEVADKEAKRITAERRDARWKGR